MKAPAPVLPLVLALSLPRPSREFSFHLTTASSSSKGRASPKPLSSTATTAPPFEVGSGSDAGANSATTAEFWKWRGHDIYTEARSPPNDPGDANKPSAILLHGFGASTVYWRETMSVLEGEGYDVHALDLLGLGRSSKPFPAVEVLSAAGGGAGAEVDVIPQYSEMGVNTDADVEYSIDLWANMVDDYARHCELNDVVLMGNSLGSLVALSLATGDFTNSSTQVAYLAEKSGESKVKGLCLFNCGVGLNSRNIIKNPSFGPVRRAMFSWLFDVLNGLIFGNRPLLRYALNEVVTKDLLESALKGLYVHQPQRVDGELVDSFYYPAKLGGDGAVEAIRQIYCNEAGFTPMEYHEKYPEILDRLPLHLIWGLDDAVTPIEGDVGIFYCDRVANNRGGRGMTTIDCIQSGHIPFDDNPEVAHSSMLNWLQKRVAK